MTLDGVDPNAQYNGAIIDAAMYSHLVTVKYFMTLDDVEHIANNNHDIRYATIVENWHLWIVKHLMILEGVDPTTNNNLVIWYVVNGVHLEDVEYLITLNGVDSNVDNNYDIWYASGGHLYVVKYLMASMLSTILRQ